MLFVTLFQWGLLIYDVFWVFATDVMVTVAKSFDAPIKLLFPRGPGERPSMLGLGDIVVPGILSMCTKSCGRLTYFVILRQLFFLTSNSGIFISLMLRLDYSLFRAAKIVAVSEVNKLRCNTFYFWAVMLGYFVGLSTTVFVMYQFNAAQVCFFRMFLRILFILPGLRYNINGLNNIIWW